MSAPRRNVRALACTVLENTLTSLAPVDPVLSSHEGGLEERDRRLLHQMVFGVLRWLRRLDFIIAEAASRRAGFAPPRGPEITMRDSGVLRHANPRTGTP